MPSEVRVLPHQDLTAPSNMALDEAVLEAVAAGESPPTLRSYGFRGRWLSLGMAESIGDLDQTAAASANLRLLRRPSGGAAVLHLDQIAWSLALPAGHALAPGDIVESYRLQSEIALQLCRRLEIDARAVPPAEARAPLPDPVLGLACFGGLAPYEIVVGDPPRKLIGWGQVRRRGVVMHHAVMSRRFDAFALARVLDADTTRLGIALEGRVTDLAQAAGRPVALGALLDALHASHRAAGLTLAPAPATLAERSRAAALLREKYARQAWTFRR
jgi:lipoate-protein ligase A